MNYKKELEGLKEAVVGAAEIVGIEYNRIHPVGRSPFSMHATGTGEIDLRIKSDDTPVTSADIASKDFLRKRLRERFCGYRIVTEEDDEAEIELAREGRSSRMFVVDPLEGTKPFLYGEGDFGVSGEFLENFIPIAGAVYNVARQELYFALRGKGAWKEVNGVTQRLRVNSKNKLEAVVSTSRASEELQGLLDTLGLTREQTRQMRSSLKAIEVASGAANLYPVLPSSPTGMWDVAPYHTIVTEAGGRFTNILGNAFNYREMFVAVDRKNYAGILATNGIVHRSCVRKVRAALKVI